MKSLDSSASPAKVLNGENWENEWQKFDRSRLGGIFSVAAEAQPKLRVFAESASDAQLAQQYKITAAAGRVLCIGQRINQSA